MNLLMKRPVPESDGEPTWDIALLFPNQGYWSEADYFGLSTNRLVEFSNGFIEVLPLPTMLHQKIVAFLYEALVAFVRAGALGEVLFSAFKVRLWEEKYREPDVVFMSAAHADRMTNEYWLGADLVMEVVSDSNRTHDIETKRAEYALAGIPEYWIVDPQEGKITVLRLEGQTYVVHGEFAKGATATSALLPGFQVDVTAALTGTAASTTNSSV